MRFASSLTATVLVLGVVFAATQASAISRYNSKSMSCTAIQAAVLSEGAVILRWKQPPNIQRYDRFVAHSGYCGPGEVAVPSSVPSAILPVCPVLECKRCKPDTFGLFLRWSCQ
ncbi:MAG: hypothetical protein ACTSP2_09605 [Alphaproteobacteria bacterium]